MAAVLYETGLEANCLDLEITEGLLMHDVERHCDPAPDQGDGRAAVHRRFWHRLLFPELPETVSDRSVEIDRSFVRDVGTDQDDTAITLAVIAMAHSMRLEVVAEGVETKEQLAFLRANQCDVIQGYYLSRPAPPSQIAALLREKAPALLAGRWCRAAWRFPADAGRSGVARRYAQPLQNPVALVQAAEPDLDSPTAAGGVVAYRTGAAKRSRNRCSKRIRSGSRMAALAWKRSGG